MVTITKGSNVLVVTRGAFENMYKCQGYTEVKQETGATQFAPEVPVEVVTEDSDEVKEAKAMEEKPLSQWTKAEVRRYAELKGISLAGTKNVTEAKALIQSAMEG